MYQNDGNSAGLLNYRHNFGRTLTGLLSVSASSGRLDIRNHNPSIEFNPTVLRKSTQTELTGSVTQPAGTHTFKGGFQLTNQTGDEYQSALLHQCFCPANPALQTLPCKLCRKWHGYPAKRQEALLRGTGTILSYPREAWDFRRLRRFAARFNAGS